MTDEVLNPREFRARTIAGNRPAFELWKATWNLIESAISAPRMHPDPFSVACDLLFIQAYKASCSVYFLALRGHEEDAAAILRRLLEVGAQIGYLDQSPNPAERQARAEVYLQHNPESGGYWWGRTFKDLFCRLNLAATYDQDYRFLAQIAHAAARRVLPEVKDSVVQIRNTEFFTPLLVFACRYLLWAARIWNSCFTLVDNDELGVTRNLAH